MSKTIDIVGSCGPPRESIHSDHGLVRAVRMRDVAQVVWRQHRWLFMTSALPVLIVCAGLLWINSSLGGVSACVSERGADACAPAYGRPVDVGAWLLKLSLALPLLAAVFWAAPLLPREYEQGTHKLAWGQDVSPARWLLVKFGVTAMAATVLAVPTYLCTRIVTHNLLTLKASATFASSFDSVPFVTSSPLVVPYSVCAIAVGLAAGSLLRRTLPSMAISLVAFGGLQILIAQLLRPHYLSPSRAFTSTESTGANLGSNPLVLTQNAWSDAAGNIKHFPSACLDSSPFDACLHAHGVTNRVTVYQPGGRLIEFQFIETAVVLLLASALVGIAVLLLRRRRDAH